MVPKNSTKIIAVSCRANTGPVHQQTPVLFEPNQLAHLQESLEVYETLLYMKPGKTSRVQIAVCNRTDHNIVLNGHTEADVQLSGCTCRTLCEHQHLEQHGLRVSDIPVKKDKQGKHPPSS